MPAISVFRVYSNFIPLLTCCQLRVCFCSDQVGRRSAVLKTLTDPGIVDIWRWRMKIGILHKENRCLNNKIWTKWRGCWMHLTDFINCRASIYLKNSILFCSLTIFLHNSHIYKVIYKWIIFQDAISFQEKKYMTIIVHVDIFDAGTFLDQSRTS